LGGLVLTLGGEGVWRVIFAMNLPLGAGALWLLARHAIPDQGRPGTKVDIWGAVLATLCLGAMAVALTEGEALALPAGGLAIAAAVAFLWVESRLKAPMIRLDLFANRQFSAVNLATLLLYIGLNGVSFYLPMTAISVWHITPLGVTAAFLPISICIALLSGRAGRLAERIGFGWPLTLGSLMVALAYGLIAHFAPAQDFWHLTAPFCLLTGLGLALVVGPLTACVMAAAPESDQGAASGINNATARAAGLIAVALMGRIALWSYGPVSADMPGFGLAQASAAHTAASSLAFAHIAATCGVLALAAAAVSAFGLIRRA
jgi:predicted MFS family arabinose efflux permease